MKAEVVGADKANEILDRALKLRNPEKWATRRKNLRKRGTTSESIYVEKFDGKTLNGLAMLGLTDLNREFSFARYALYLEEMAAGRWYDSADPIVITEDGYIVNGQHRLVAASRVEWEGDEIPQFVVVSGVNKKAALLMDEAARSKDDRRHIALRFADVVSKAA